MIWLNNIAQSWSWTRLGISLLASLLLGAIGLT
jgi:hypothetical protein